MKINLCEIFGVEEGEEFKLDYDNKYITNWWYKIENNFLHTKQYIEDEYYKCAQSLNVIAKANIIKLPKKKQFTDDELAIMRSLPKKYEWMARDLNKNELWLYQRKPTKDEYGNWGVNGEWYILGIYKHLFKSITNEDEEPIFIDDYVERGVE